LFPEGGNGREATETTSSATPAFADTREVGVRLPGGAFLSMPTLMSQSQLRGLMLVETNVLWGVCLFAFIWLLLPATETRLAVPKSFAFLAVALLAFANVFRKRMFVRADAPLPRLILVFYIVDLVAATVAVSVTGGASSPFILYYLIAIFEAAVVHGRIGGFAAALLCSALCMAALEGAPRLIPTAQEADVSILEHSLYVILFLSVGALVGSYEELRAASVRARARPQCCAQLSPRERQIARYVLEGLTNKEIAAALGRSEKTVRNQVSAILRKCGASSRYELAEMCRAAGIDVEDCSSRAAPSAREG